MTTPEGIDVRRGPFSMEEPWSVPEGVAVVALRRATDGAAPRLATTVAVWRDDDFLTLLFSGADDRVQATYTGHDDPLYEEDVVEAFLAPRSIEEYFEIEVNPLATTFDARILSPDGVRQTMSADRGWTCEGLVALVRRETQGQAHELAADTLIRIPFASLGVPSPAPGDTWRANLFRIDRHPAGDEFSAWQPTLRQPADFHVSAAFGTLRFE